MQPILIKDWDKEDKDALVAIAKEIAKDFTVVDVHASGSRVFGWANILSDLDIICWIREEKPLMRPAYGVYKDVKYSITIKQLPLSGIPHENAYIGSPHKPEGRNLRAMSLIDDKIYGTGDDEIWHREFRKTVNRLNCEQCKKGS